MKIPCTIAGYTLIKKGAKLTFTIPEEKVQEVTKYIANFMNMPLNIEVLTDAEKRKEQLNQISGDQRKKIFALFNDIAAYTGDTIDNTKENLKALFLHKSQHDDFSLSNCSSQLANDFITFLISFAFENGVDLSEHPVEGLQDIESYLKMCLDKKICACCGQDGSPRIAGTGRICLCDTHYAKAQMIGMEKFMQEFKVWGV